MLNPKPLTRRDLIARAGAGILGIAVVGTLDACSSPAPIADLRSAGERAGSSPTSVPSLSSAPVVTPARPGLPAVAEIPRSGGTLRYASLGDYPTLDGHGWWLPTFDNLWNVWDRLTFNDEKMQPQPMLAESWDISSDYTQIKFNLRKGVQFHTGRELTAEDVKWSLLRMQDPKVGGGIFAGRARVMTSIESPEKYVVVVKASRPWAEAFDFFEYANIIDPVTFQDAGLSKPTGTGPFVFSEYVQGDHLRLTRNPNYWRKDRPYLDEVFVTLSRDAQASVLQLEAGAIDAVGFGLPVADAVRLLNDDNYKVFFDTASGAYWNLNANCRVAPTNNKSVRQALHYALDRKRIAETTWLGRSKPEALPWSPSSPAYDAPKATAFGFDLDKARSLLASSGESNLKLELVWSTSLDQFAGPAQIYQADLAKLGVTLALKPLDPPIFIQAALKGSFQGLLVNLGFFGNLGPATLVLGTNLGPDANAAGFADASYTQLVSQVLGATDLASQKSVYARLNDFWLDQAWSLPIVQNPPHMAARAGVRGLRYDAHEAVVLSDVWLA